MPPLGRGYEARSLAHGRGVRQASFVERRELGTDVGQLLAHRRRFGHLDRGAEPGELGRERPLAVTLVRAGARLGGRGQVAGRVLGVEGVTLAT